MAKIKLTKNELKKQKDALKRFNRYLPTLVLKKQQLQSEIRKIEYILDEKQMANKKVLDYAAVWAALFNEDVGLDGLVNLEKINITETNIAGIDIPVFKGVDFTEAEYDLFSLPLWVDEAVLTLKQVLGLEAEIRVLEEQILLLGEELRITTQRVNLFEKVKIPEARENIRRILVFLGDQQTAAVVRGKISKRKLVEIT